GRWRRADERTGGGGLPRRVAHRFVSPSVGDRARGARFCRPAACLFCSRSRPLRKATAGQNRRNTRRSGPGGSLLVGSVLSTLAPLRLCLEEVRSPLREGCCAANALPRPGPLGRPCPIGDPPGGPRRPARVDE